MPQVAPRRSFASAVLTTLAVTVLGCSITLNFWMLVMGGFTAMLSKAWYSNASPDEGSVKRTTLVEGSSERRVYVLDIAGTIVDATEERFGHVLKIAREDSATRAVIVHIDTPGGAVTPSDNIYEALRKFRKAKGVPVVITQDGFATSGGYYISAAGDYVFASKTTWTGNIGVIMPGYDFSGLMARYDVRDKTLVSTGATFKDAGSPTKPEDPAQRAYLQDLMDKAFARFKEVVVQGRGSKLTQPINAIANGKVYTADDAKALGLVDDIGTLDEALAYLASAKGIAGPEVIHLEEPQGIFSSLVAAKGGLRPPSSSLLNVDVGGAKVDVPRSALDEFLSPRPMYLWRAR